MCRNAHQENVLRPLKTDNGGPWGSWGTWSDTCDVVGICGIETRVDLERGSGDETALNDVRMYCCPASDIAWGQ